MSSADFQRLTLADEPEILALLQNVWPRLYGETGCPQFSGDYLRWLYGGPDASRHLLLGCRIGGRMVGLKSYLSRDILLDGGPRSASLSTHLTISPDLDPSTRLSIAAELSRLHILTSKDQQDRRDVLLAFFESNKALLRNAARMALQHKLNFLTIPFAQAIVNPRRISAAAAGVDGITLRALDPAADLPDLATLSQGLTTCRLVWQPGDNVRLHHLTQAPGAFVRIATDQVGRICGVLGGYRLDWLKNGAITQMLIVETLVSNGTEAAASLLAEAVRHANHQGYRGVVVENPSLIEATSARTLGIMTTQREMVLTIRTPLALPDAISAFALDVK